MDNLSFYSSNYAQSPNDKLSEPPMYLVCPPYRFPPENVSNGWTLWSQNNGPNLELNNGVQDASTDVEFNRADPHVPYTGFDGTEVTEDVSQTNGVPFLYEEPKVLSQLNNSAVDFCVPYHVSSPNYNFKQFGKFSDSWVPQQIAPIFQSDNSRFSCLPPTFTVPIVSQSNYQLIQGIPDNDFLIPKKTNGHFKVSDLLNESCDEHPLLTDQALSPKLACQVNLNCPPPNVISEQKESCEECPLLTHQVPSLKLPAPINLNSPPPNVIIQVKDSTASSLPNQNVNQSFIEHKSVKTIELNQSLKDLEVSSTSITALEKIIKTQITDHHQPTISSTSRSFCTHSNGNENKALSGRLELFDNAPLVMFITSNPEHSERRRSLPIFKHRQEILDLIDARQVTVIAGDSGCGKTTQVPQYILEHAYEKKTPCKIVSVQIRSISAIAAADRVSSELGVTGERLVGYITRSEVRGSTYCQLTYCTTGVFLRSLMNDTNCFTGISHLIIDQVHERDRFTDLLLGYLRLRLPKYPDFRVILLCANVNVQSLVSYFHEEKFVEIEYPSSPKSEFFLDEMLMSPKFLLWNQKEKPVYEPYSTLNALFAEAWFKGTDAVFSRLIELVDTGKIPVDYRHSDIGVTLLMAAAIHGKVEFVKSAMKNYADPTLQVKGMNTFDLANEFCRFEVASLIVEYYRKFSNKEATTDGLESSSYEKDWIENFYLKWSQENVKLDLIVSMIDYALGFPIPGTILVFLPSYREVKDLSDMIPNGLFEVEVYSLHSQLTLSDYKKIFQPSTEKKRKLIIATDLAETSMSFEDVYCVIDSGLIRDRENDTVFMNNRRAKWISKASALQRYNHIRKGGIMLRAYPRSRMEGFVDYTIPEITRVPLLDVCLYSSMLLSEELRYSKFFGLLPDGGPPAPSVHQAAHALKKIYAIDEKQRATALGVRLIDLPIDPRLAKMILMGISLKCIDPILTLASFLSRDDPFIVPFTTEERQRALQNRNDLVTENYSDHLAFLKIFEMWITSPDERLQKKFCERYCLSSGYLEMVASLRGVLVHLLRSCGYFCVEETCRIQNLNAHCQSWSGVKAAITGGLYPNLASLSLGGTIIFEDQPDSMFHFLSTFFNIFEKDSSVFDTTSLCLVFEEKQMAGKYLVLKSCSSITPITALLFAGTPSIEEFSGSKKSENSGAVVDWSVVETCCFCEKLNFVELGLDWACKDEKVGECSPKRPVVLRIDEHIAFVVGSYAAHLIVAARQKFLYVFGKYAENPTREGCEGEDSFIYTLLSVLATEELISIYSDGHTAVSGSTQESSEDVTYEGTKAVQVESSIPQEDSVTVPTSEQVTHSSSQEKCAPGRAITKSKMTMDMDG